MRLLIALFGLICCVTLYGQAGDLSATKKTAAMSQHEFGKPADEHLQFLNKTDLSFLEQLTREVIDSSRILPGQVVSSLSLKNNTGGILIRPGARDAYPSFWIRDYAMSLETGMIDSAEQRHMLMLTAATQCDEAWITKNGSMVPYGAIADHIRINDGLPVYFPGTLEYADQGNKVFGMLPPLCDQFYFVQMLYIYVELTGNRKMLLAQVNGKRMIDRAETAFGMVPTRENGIVYTDSSFRAVDFGFRDAVVITGELCFPSILKYKAALQLAYIFGVLGNQRKKTKYQQIAQKIKAALPVVFSDSRGMLRASTGKSGQPDVWSTALAVYEGILEGEARTRACKLLTNAYANGSLAYKGNIRHILHTDDFNANTAWESSLAAKNRYQNGAYWGTPTGWVCYAMAQADPAQARKLAGEYIADLRETDFRRGGNRGGPYECFFPPDHQQNPIYMATVACPYIVFKRAHF